MIFGRFVSLFLLILMTSTKGTSVRKELKEQPTYGSPDRQLFTQYFGHFAPTQPMSNLAYNPGMGMNMMMGGLLGPMFMPMGGAYGSPILARASYPGTYNLGSMPAPDPMLMDKKLYADDMTFLNAPGDYPRSLQSTISAEEASNQNEITEQLATFAPMSPSEVQDFQNFVGEVIASGPLI